MIEKSCLNFYHWKNAYIRSMGERCVESQSTDFQRSQFRDQISHTNITSLDNFGIDSSESQFLSGGGIYNLESGFSEAPAELATSVV